MCSRFPLVLAAASLLVVGCASQSRTAAPARDADADADGYRARPAAALVFDPPATQYVDPDRLADALDRDGRGNSAVLGYDSPVVETSYVYVDDRQGFFGADLGYGFGGYGYGFGGFGGRYDNYERRAVSTREFVRSRP